MPTYHQELTDPELEHARLALAGALDMPFWLDDSARPEPRPSLTGQHRCDLVVVGGGYTGLWTALQAKERQPELAVILVEGGTIGWAASGRNGGFCDASLTHGASNGRMHLPGEYERLEELGLENLGAIEAAVERYGWDCEFERTGSLNVATEEYQVAELRDAAEGGEGEFLDATAVRGLVNSPVYRAGLREGRGTALVNPAKLAWELARTCRDLGVVIYENTVARKLTSNADTVTVHTGEGQIEALRCALGTNAFPSLLPSVARQIVPVYDYAIMTEPLTEAQLDAIGWSGREGLGDVSNQFHYYRLSADNRILWGGFDAVYYFGRKVSPRYEFRPETFERLAGHFFATFPQLRDVKFTHQWGGAIDTCSRFFSFFVTAHGGKVAATAGFTGLGVGATRFGAQVMLDLLSGAPTELTELEMVRRRPIPFPPEPLAWAGIKATTASLVRADANEGKRNVLLRALDSVGMGFDS